MRFSWDKPDWNLDPVLDQSPGRVFYFGGSTLVLLAMVGILLTGCASQRQAITLDPIAFSSNIESIIVTPVIDVRDDNFASFDIDDIERLRSLAVAQLEKHGYRVQLLDKWESNAPLSSQDIADMSVDEICNLTPPDTKIFFTIIVNNIHYSYDFVAHSYTITSIMMAVDRQQRKEIWKDMDTGISGFAGSPILTGVAMIGTRSNAQKALVNCIFKSFPNKK